MGSNYASMGCKHTTVKCIEKIIDLILYMTLVTNSLKMQMILIHFIPNFHFFTPWKCQKTSGFLTLSVAKGTLTWNVLIAFSGVTRSFLEKATLKISTKAPPKHLSKNHLHSTWSSPGLLDFWKSSSRSIHNTWFLCQSCLDSLFAESVQLYF